MARWDLLTSNEIEAMIADGRDLAVLPVGATEQHGPHLACGCDTISAETLAQLACERANVLALPALAYGCSLGHTEKWTGTFSLHPGTMIDVIVELGRWAVANGITKLLFLSGHGTNDAPLKSAILQLRYEFPEARFATMGLWDISPRVGQLYFRDGADIHANRGETSVLLHLRPEMVRMEESFDVADVTPGTHFSYAMPATTPTGVVGSPSESTEEDGAMMVETIVSDLAAWLETALAEDWPTLPEGPKA
ncbi:creatininase family protein [Methyloligella solikamskensis]|uniref:Creatininase family protein n=1 Tax=Methyloligella solikamskensis TaxID=1177756 RepID=A0ABW3JBX2_9HYPH